MSVLLYDPDCGFCTASANLLRRLGPGARILPGTPENLVQYRVDTRRFAHALPFINDAGQIIYGSDAIALTLISRLTSRLGCTSSCAVKPA